jgi:predicted Zn-ribbon and HTH transcriptional regulator
MLELKLIEHCAPTLAGLKSANLFNYEFSSIDTLMEELQQVNQKLNGKGVYIEILKTNPARCRAMLYVYRKTKLQEEMQKPGVASFLENCGCANCSEEYCIQYLRLRLQQEEFPHEIGVFLGYPLEDVLGFIKFKGHNCKCSGIWKVYGNEDETQKLFAKFKKCTSVYARQFANGRSISQLTVAA